MNVVIAQPVKIALRTLGHADRQRVVAWFDHLRNWENDPTVRDISKRLDDSGNVYVLQTTTDIRIFFSLTADTITVLDVARKATIMSFGESPG
jgi:hypothetical protein